MKDTLADFEQPLIRQFQHAKFSFLLVDNAFTILYTNDYAREHMPLFSSPDALRILFSHERLNRFQSALAQGESISVSEPILEASDTTFCFTPLLNGENVIGSSVVVFPHRTPEGAAQAETKGSSAFSASFRQPLAEILASVSVLHRRTMMRGDHALDSYIQSINTNCYLILRNVRNLTRKLQTEASAPPCVVIDLWEHLAELMEACSIVLQKAHVRLQYSFPKTPAIVRCDFSAVSDAVMNILSNACHAAQEPAVITVTGRTLERFAAVTISDNGTGMTREQLDRLFTPYAARGESSVQRAGLGMGSSTAKKMIVDAGGTLAVDSAPGQGTSVAFTLPLYDGAVDSRLPMEVGSAQYLEDQFSAVHVGLCDVVPPPIK